MKEDVNLNIIWHNEKFAMAICTYPGYIYTKGSRWNLFDDGTTWELVSFMPSHKEVWIEMEGDVRVVLFRK